MLSLGNAPNIKHHKTCMLIGVTFKWEAHVKPKVGRKLRTTKAIQSDPRDVYGSLPQEFTAKPGVADICMSNGTAMDSNPKAANKLAV